MLTRSSAILDLTAVGADEAIILCPANHSPPTYVAPYPGTPGYEAVATCLASPEVRAQDGRRHRVAAAGRIGTLNEAMTAQRCMIDLSPLARGLMKSRQPNSKAGVQTCAGGTAARWAGTSQPGP